MYVCMSINNYVVRRILTGYYRHPLLIIIISLNVHLLMGIATL